MTAIEDLDKKLAKLIEYTKEIAKLLSYYEMGIKDLVYSYHDITSEEKTWFEVHFHAMEKIEKDILELKK